MATEKIIDRIAKLLKMAEGAKKVGNMEEAEAFSAKVSELLTEHNLNEWEIRQHSAKKDDQFDKWGFVENVSHKENQAGDRWQKDLIKMLCRHNMVGVIFNVYDKGHPKHKTFDVYGEITGVETTVWLYNWLSTNLMILAKQARLELSKEDYDAQCRHTYLKDFLVGAIDGVDIRLTKQAKQSPAAGRIWEMIKYNDKALEKFAEKTYPGMFSTKPRNIRDKTALGYDAGMETGLSIDLGDGKKLKSGAVQKGEGKLLN